LLAVEHVWGRNVPPEVDNTYCGQHFEACKEEACQELFGYWASCPLSSAYDGEHYSAREIPFLIDVFSRYNFSLETLFKIQQERIENLFKAIEKNDSQIAYLGCGGVKLNQLVECEIQEHMKVLQDLIRGENAR